jgi:hypothetical protein
VRRRSRFGTPNADYNALMARPWIPLALIATLAGCAGAPPSRPPAKVSCAAGPVEASFGALAWLAYACDDGRSVALMSAPGNPAAPFSFIVRPSATGVRVQGEGDGDRAMTAAAFAELMALDDESVVRLYERALLESDPVGPDATH